MLEPAAIVTADPTRLEAERNWRDEQIIRRIAELHERKQRIETEALRMFRPLPHAEAFHASRKMIRIGWGGNQGAKTIHFCVELARAVCGCDPYDKYPTHNGRAVIIGLNLDHLADPIFHKLFHDGEFKLIADEHTGKLRAVRWSAQNPRVLDPYDEAYREKWVDAPPLIPPRLCNPKTDIAWEDKAKEIPRVVKIPSNGWRMLWRSSGSDPPRGIQAHVIYADEELATAARWVNEIIPRLLIKHGFFLWSATPQHGGAEFYELYQKAIAESTRIDEFSFHIEKNPFLSDDQRAALKEALTSAEEVAVRYHGHFLFASRRIYPDWDPQGIHGCEPFEVPVDKWTRYVYLDPARQRQATLFFAVDPEERHAWLYDGFVLQPGNADMWAAEVARREQGYKFEQFVIDPRAGGQHTMVGDATVAEQYYRAAKKIGLLPRTAGAAPGFGGFVPGCKEVEAREEALKTWLLPRDSSHPAGMAGEPTLKKFRGILLDLDRQVQYAAIDAKRKRIQADTARPEDELADLEYAAAHRPGYFKPEPVIRTDPSQPKQLTPREHFERHHRKSGGVRFDSALHVGKRR